MSNHNSLSIVIPAYNEARRLPATLASVAEYLRTSVFGAHEIIVVDDGSSDATVRVAEEFARKRDIKNVRILRAPKNQGKGAALQRGVLASHGEFVLCTDADLSTPIGEMDKLLRPIRAGADVAIGSRSVAGSVVTKKPLYRQALSGVSSLIIRNVLGLPFRDTQCGFKLYRREAAMTLFKTLHLPRFSFDFEVLSRAKSAGMRVAEVGVHWEHSDFTTVRTRDVAQSFIDVFRIRFGLTQADSMMQLGRFMTVGVANTLIDASVYVGLTRFTTTFSHDIVAAKFFSFLAATISSLYLNRYWTFGIRSRLTLREVARFYATVSASLVLNVVLMYLFVHVIGIYDLVALVLTTLMTFGLNYTLSRLWVFKGVERAVVSA
ncbi:MAG TPA: bifunctional glycosyltransferase family 2/GtrA family protein [Candidatus Paceibacterota bacterium]|jgi:dolichyl-phosphate beta-glucosyltransferase|nr:bifunctional glycosyltransferase family 2/GtrA family protein [Candidatus Paceibacterota bacterium]